MQSWSAPLRPNEHAERSIIQAILAGDFPPGGRNCNEISVNIYVIIVKYIIL
jgi:hypothetical protein